MSTQIIRRDASPDRSAPGPDSGPDERRGATSGGGRIHDRGAPGKVVGAVVYPAARRGAAHAREWDRRLATIAKTT
jgi:hypothetical protein